MRVAFREDNLGLGAKIGSGQGAGECTGLDGLQDLLGRLNGKNGAVLKREREGRGEKRRVVYAERRFGGWGRFVKGGVLVGDEGIVKVRERVGTVYHDGEEALTRDEGVVESSAGDAVLPSVQEVVAEKRKVKKSKLSRSKRTDTEHLQSAALPVPLSGADVPKDILNEDIRPAGQECLQHIEDKARRKAEKVQRKLERQRRREDKARLKEKKKTDLSALTISKSEELVAAPVGEKKEAAIMQPTSTPAFSGGRHAVRQRFILQKKAAMMDPKALNEVSCTVTLVEIMRAADDCIDPYDQSIASRFIDYSYRIYLFFYQLPSISGSFLSIAVHFLALCLCVCKICPLIESPHLSELRMLTTLLSIHKPDRY